MLRHSLRGLAVAAIAACTLGPVPAAAVTQLSSCAVLDKAGETYVLTADITTSLNACFLVLADRITIDLGGHTVTGSNTFAGAGIWDNNATRTATVVKNGTITNYNFGILLEFSTRNTVRSVNMSGNGLGIVIGPNSLVKDCVVQRNASEGIRIGDRGQVESCVVGDATPGAGVDGNGGIGILGGNRLLATRNTVIGNGGTGIVARADSTVTYNTVTNNARDGVNVGQRSLVTYNTANDNRDGIFVDERSTVNYNTAADNSGDGILAACPSTVMYNEVGPNQGQNIHTLGTGCVVKNNQQK